MYFLKQQLQTIRQRGKRKRKKKTSKTRRSSKSVADTSSTPKPTAPKKVKEPRPKPAPKAPPPPKMENREITFEEKRELSELINQLDGDKLEHVVQIIRDNLKDLPTVSVSKDISRLMDVGTRGARD